MLLAGGLDIWEDTAEACPAPRGRLRKMCSPLLNDVGALMTKKKKKILNVFFTLVFTGKMVEQNQVSKHLFKKSEDT